MSNTVLPIRAQLARGSFTTGCAVATIGILVCGFVAPSVEASGIRSEVRVVRLASLTGPMANPLGVLVGTLPAAAAAAATAAPVAPLPTGGPADVPTSVEPLVDPEPAAAIAQVAEASDGGMTVGQWVVMTVIQSVAAIGRLFPENDPIRLFFAAFVLFGTFLGAGIVAPFIDSVVNLVLWPFGLGTSAVAPLAAVAQIEPSGETVTSDPVQSTPDEAKGVAAQVAGPDSGRENIEFTIASTEPEASLPAQVPAEALAELTQTTGTVDAVEVESTEAVGPAAAAEASTEPEPDVAVEQEGATDTVDPADDVTEAESTTAQDEPTAEAGDPDGPSDNTAAKDSSSAPASKGSESSGDTAE